MNRLVRIALGTAAALLAALPMAAAQELAITGGTVYVDPQTVLDGATILVRDGKILRVGKDLPAPAGAKVIDARGKIVTAGFIEASSRIGLVEVALEGSTREAGFPSSGSRGEVVYAGYQVIDGYNPRSVAIAIARAHGVTSAVAVPQGGLVSGQSAWMSLISGPVSAIAIRAPAAMHATLGEGAQGSARGSRGLALMHLRELFEDTRLYSQNQRSFDRNQTRPLAAGRLDLAALIPVLRGQLPLVIRVNRSSDIEAVMRLAQELRLRVVIEGGAEAWMVADQLAAANIGVVLNPEDNLPSSFDSIHVRDDNAKLLADAGVRVAISTLGDSSQARTIRQLAGMAVASGMRRDHALAALTTVPAQLFGDPQRGAVKAGAVADLVVWSGDPFELSTAAEHVIIGGLERSTRTRQTELLERYRNLPGVTADPAPVPHPGRP